MKVGAIIFGFAAVFSCTTSALFVPGHLQEHKLVRALLNGYSETDIYSRIASNGLTRSRRSSGQVEGNPALKDYMFALQEHHSLQQRNKEKNAILCGTKHIGGCARMYPDIMESWGYFFKKRNFQARAVRPILQFNTGEDTMASFGRYSLNGYTADDVKAVDLIVSRSSATNQVVYGRYHFQVSTTGDLIVYDDQQATCGKDEKSYFALGLNDNGHEMIRNWMNGENETFELSVRAQIMKQISRGSNDNFIRTLLDVGANIEALMLHLRVPVPKPFPKAMFPELVAKRRTRRSWRPGPNDCRRKRYIVSFKYNPQVIKPETADIGICEGSCMAARMPPAATALNATGHTMKMLWNRQTNTRQFGNPEPKACCFPNTYGTFHFLTTDHLDNLYVDYVEEMIATGCSCR